MLDFTSALYLGLRHPSRSLRPWAQFTTGRPAALASPPGARSAAQTLAALQGCEAGVLGPSTLHLFWDLFGVLAQQPVAIYMDAGLYPIGRWGVERAAARGVPVRCFPHHDVDALRCLLRRDARQCLQPLVVADGFCPGCGRPAPISEYLESARAFGGRLILDDTQALGILGHSPGPGAPFGRGGGGMLPWSNVKGPDVLLVSSLAKGFGVPVAVLSGTKTAVRGFEMKSETRVHCSPPSVAVVHAAEHAMTVNRERGDALRLRLAQLIRRFRNQLAQAGFSIVGGLFPVQTLAPLSQLDPAALHRRLLQAGVRTVLHYARNGHGLRISFVLTARHNAGEINRSVEVLGCVARGTGKSNEEVSHGSRICRGRI